MDFEKIYVKLPDFIKYNNFIYNASAKLAKKLKNNKNSEIDSMNQILQLVLTSSNFEITGTLKNYHRLFVQLLRFIDNVSNKYDIEYYIEGGTLIGAVRHGGFIPWDDDVDISVMRKDFNKLIEVLPLEIKKYPKLMENCALTMIVENFDNYFKEFNSVYDVKTTADGYFKSSFIQFGWLAPFAKIDIFVKDYIEKEKLKQYIDKYEIEKFKFKNELKNGKIDFFEELENKKQILGQTDNPTQYCGFSVEHLIPERPVIYDVNDIYPLKRIKFEEYDFNCPNNPDEYLKKVFGDYMKIPKVIEHHNILDFVKNQFINDEDLNTTLIEAIDYLKEINDNFK